MEFANRDLHGVPVTIKNNDDQKGRSTRTGVKAFTDVVAPDDAPFVKKRQVGLYVA